MKNGSDITSSAGECIGSTGITDGGGAGKLFLKHFRAEPDAAVFVPYRICPLGAHVDHNLGLITGFAIDRGIRAAYRAADGRTVEAVSNQFDGAASWDIADIPGRKLGDWADHLRGASLALSKRYRLERGIRIAFDGELPIGGLSSSAAVTIAFLEALSDANSIALSGDELIDLALEAENAYVGVSCGRLDQSCEVWCRRDHLLYMDMKTGERELVP